nr:MAG: replication associated protein [Cressdnaviricota sp.]
MSAKHWCFTSYRDDEPQPNGRIQYMVYQRERCPTTERLHWQGYIYLAKKSTLSWIKNNIDSEAHWTKCAGDFDANFAYCTKESTRLEGTEPTEIGKGNRSDLNEFQYDVTQGRTEDETRDTHPEIWAKYGQWAREEHARYRDKELNRRTPSPLPDEDWAVQLREQLDADPDRRKILWFVDKTGGRGKSSFARKYVSRTDTPNLGDQHGYIINGGRHSDIYYGYQGQRVVFFDWSRDHQDAFPYSVVENFKNGYFLSTKYVTRAVRFRPPHVVVFTNWDPDTTKLSEDRWEIKEL